MLGGLQFAVISEHVAPQGRPPQLGSAERHECSMAPRILECWEAVQACMDDGGFSIDKVAEYFSKLPAAMQGRTCARRSCRSSARSAWPRASSGTWKAQRCPTVIFSVLTEGEQREFLQRSVNQWRDHCANRASSPTARTSPSTHPKSPKCRACSAAWSGAARATHSTTPRRAVRTLTQTKEDPDIHMRVAGAISRVSH